MHKEKNLQKINRYQPLAKKGFTLIELLIVIAIIAIIAAVVFVALDPLTRFQDARDAQRWQNVSAVLNAIKVDQVDNGGTYLTAIAGLTDGLYYVIGTDGACITACGAQAVVANTCVDLSGIATEGYISAIPADPSTGTAANTDYYIMKAATGIVTVGACDEEGSGGAISVSR